MADFVTISEVFIKEEPLEQDVESNEIGAECKDPCQIKDTKTDKLNHLVNEDNIEERHESKETKACKGYDSESIENSKGNESRPNHSAEENELETGENDLSGQESDSEEDNENEESKCEDEMEDEDELASSSLNIFEPEVSIESEEEDLKCSGGDDDDSFYDDESNAFEDLDYIPSDEEYKSRKSSKNDNRERTVQCPICMKFFLTSSAMNGHVAKWHGTTLGVKFTCHICGAPGSSRASLKRHLIRTHKIKNVDHPELLTKKCTHCGVGFSSHLLLYKHMREEHSEELKDYFNCNWCPALMRAKASLIRHIRRTHPDKEVPYLSSERCLLCHETFSSRVMLQRHMKASHPDTPRHVCSICNAGFQFPYLLTRHKLIHEDPQKYQEARKKKRYIIFCEFCGRKFGSKPRLDYHVEVVHTNPPIKIYTCRMCGLTFPTAKQNNRHYRRVHRPERQKIHCGKCNITFNTAEECSQHRALHPNTCEVCQKQFLRRDSLREHMLIHSAPRHQCPHCTKKFTQRSNLKRHIRVHTGEKPYKCSFCNRRFSDKSACNSHIRVHTGYERSVCEICGASFSKKQRLNYHMRIHTGEGLLYCPLCMRPSTNSYSLRKHIECHQQPLTKALISLGFKPLLVSDPEFVMRALQALTQATLQSMSRHENIPNSFIEEVGEQLGNGNNLLDVASTLGENNLEDCSRTLDIKKEKPEEGEEGDWSPVGGYSPTAEKSDETPFSLTKFLQGLLEKESVKMRTVRKEKNRKSKKRSRDDTSSAPSGIDERESEDDELPTTIGDELVKQCLEIIMKDETASASDDDDKIDNEAQNEDDSRTPLAMDTENPLTKEIVIKTERVDVENEYDSLGDSQCSDSLGDSQRDSESKLEPVKEIPKIKISRIANTNTDSSKDLFVAEIIKNN